MTYWGSTHPKPNVIPAIYVFNSLMKYTGAPSAPREVLAQKTKTMELLLQALEVHQGYIGNTVSEMKVAFEDKTFDLVRWQAETTKDPTVKFCPGDEVQAVIAGEVEKSIT